MAPHISLLTILALIASLLLQAASSLPTCTEDVQLYSTDDGRPIVTLTSSVGTTTKVREVYVNDPVSLPDDFDDIPGITDQCEPDQVITTIETVTVTPTEVLLIPIPTSDLFSVSMSSTVSTPSDLNTFISSFEVSSAPNSISTSSSAILSSSFSSTLISSSTSVESSTSTSEPSSSSVPSSTSSTLPTTSIPSSTASTSSPTGAVPVPTDNDLRSANPTVAPASASSADDRVKTLAIGVGVGGLALLLFFGGVMACIFWRTKSSKQAGPDDDNQGGNSDHQQERRMSAMDWVNRAEPIQTPDLIAPENRRRSKLEIKHDWDPYSEDYGTALNRSRAERAEKRASGLLPPKVSTARKLRNLIFGQKQTDDVEAQVPQKPDGLVEILPNGTMHFETTAHRDRYEEVHGRKGPGGRLSSWTPMTNDRMSWADDSGIDVTADARGANVPKLHPPEMRQRHADDNVSALSASASEFTAPARTVSDLSLNGLAHPPTANNPYRPPSLTYNARTMQTVVSPNNHKFAIGSDSDYESDSDHSVHGAKEDLDVTTAKWKGHSAQTGYPKGFRYVENGIAFFETTADRKRYEDIVNEYHQGKGKGRLYEYPDGDIRITPKQV